jgi:hypothetical protein
MDDEPTLPILDLGEPGALDPAAQPVRDEHHGRWAGRLAAVLAMCAVGAVATLMPSDRDPEQASEVAPPLRSAVTHPDAYRRALRPTDGDTIPPGATTHPDGRRQALSFIVDKARQRPDAYSILTDGFAFQKAVDEAVERALGASSLGSSRTWP